MQLQLKQINKSFAQAHILKDVDLTINSGSLFGFLGRNGAGKTTTIRILMNVFKADSGVITLDGAPFDPLTVKIGYLPEERGMYSKIKVQDQLVYFAQLRGATKNAAVADIRELAEKFEISSYLHRELETLSKGNQQKVQITQAFLNDPDILILDEPFSGLDPVNSQVFQTALNEFVKRDKVVIFSSHQMAYVERFCEDIALIDHGQIVLSGALKQIKKTMGENRLRLAANNMTNHELAVAITDVASAQISADNELIVELAAGQSKAALLACLLEKNVDLHRFQDYEPDLQEIFIAKVGHENA